MATININNLTESNNQQFVDAIPYEESVLTYNAVLTHNAQLLKLAIERIVTHKGGGSVQPVDGKAFLHTSSDGKVCIYELQSFGDTVAIHDRDGGSIIMLCDYQDGLVDACEGIDIPTTLVTAKSEEVIVPEASAEDIEEPIAEPIAVPVIRSNRRRTIAEPIIEQPAPVAEAPLSLQGEGRGESLSLTVELHANKQGECKTYYVHGKAYKSIPKDVLDKWYPAGKGKVNKGFSAFWSKARFEANGGIEQLRNELPDMAIEFKDSLPNPLPEGEREATAKDEEQPTPVPSVSTEVIEQPTEEGSNTATFPEEKKPTKKSDKPAVSPMVKQFLDLKAKHPDAVLLFRCGDFYETYCKDAEKAAKVLGITLTKSSKTKDKDGKPMAMAGFPYHALDVYLPKLIRAGHRVAICDQIEAPKSTTKHTITEVVKPAKVEEPIAEPIQAPACKENGDGSTCGEIVKFSDEMTANIKKFGKHANKTGASITFDFNGKDKVSVTIRVDDKHKKVLTEAMEHETKRTTMLVGGVSEFINELADWDGYLNIENIA